jgi:xanthine dehydrogenase accessory factor
MKSESLDKILSDRAAKRPVVLATNLTTGVERIIHPMDAAALAACSPDIAEGAREAMRSDHSTTVETAEGPVFLHIFNPPLRMIIVGAVHIAQPLARAAALTGYDVVIVDPRRAFASEERFPSVTLMSDWPDDALQALAPDLRTAVVTLTHDPKLDDPALQMALRSTAFYIGALGSKKTHGARIERLKRAGLSEAECGRICGPIGLDIGARSPPEIAVAILAQITQHLRRGNGATAALPRQADREPIKGAA